MSDIEDHTVSFSLEVNVEKAYTEIRRVQALLYRTLGLLQRMGGGDEDIMRVIAKLQRLIAIMNMVRLTAIAMHTAMGPVGWGLAAVGLAGTVMTSMDFADSVYDDTHGA